MISREIFKSKAGDYSNGKPNNMTLLDVVIVFSIVFGIVYMIYQKLKQKNPKFGEGAGQFFSFKLYHDQPKEEDPKDIKQQIWTEHRAI